MQEAICALIGRTKCLQIFIDALEHLGFVILVVVVVCFSAAPCCWLGARGCLCVIVGTKCLISFVCLSILDLFFTGHCVSLELKHVSYL